MAGVWRVHTYHLPYLAATPTRPANQERIQCIGEDVSSLSRNAALLLEVKADAKGPEADGRPNGARAVLIPEKDGCERKRHIGFIAGKIIMCGKVTQNFNRQ